MLVGAPVDPLYARALARFQHTVSFHNFKSQNFKLSVSNHKNEYVAYLSVLSQISNCQSLGRKNKHEVLKTDRTGRDLDCPTLMKYTIIHHYNMVYIYIYIYVCTI